MYIDHSLYSEFWRNPEKCRLTYFKNLVPKTKPEYFDLGGAVHRIIELRFSKLKKEAIKTKLTKEKFSPLLFDRAFRLADAFDMHRAGSAVEKKAAEMEFKFKIGDHTACGRIDEQLFAGFDLAGEIKTEKDAARTDWNYKLHHETQASFILLGMHSLGIPATVVLYTVIRESNPPRVFEFKAERTLQQLEDFRAGVKLTADTIAFFVKVYGIDRPWPHLVNAYPCSMSLKCEYEKICNGKDDKKYLKEYFKPREEHLALIGKKGRI